MTNRVKRCSEGHVKKFSSHGHTSSHPALFPSRQKLITRMPGRQPVLIGDIGADEKTEASHFSQARKIPALLKFVRWAMIVQVVVLFEGLRTKALWLADEVVAFLDRKCRD